MVDTEPLVRLRAKAREHSSLKATGPRGTVLEVKAIGGRGLDFVAQDKNGKYLGRWWWRGVPGETPGPHGVAVRPSQRAPTENFLLTLSEDESDETATIMILHEGGAGEAISFAVG